MHSVNILAAIVAFGASVTSAATTCSGDVTVTAANPAFTCQVIDGDVTIDPKLQGSLSIEGPKQITGSLIVNNVTKLETISSSTLASIGQTFQLQGLTKLTTCNLNAFKSAQSMVLINLPTLTQLTVGQAGLNQVGSFQCTDTFLQSLAGLNLTNVDSVTISNNARLVDFSVPLKTAKSISATQNGNDFNITLPYLQTVGDLDFRNIKYFDAPVLRNASRISFQGSPNLVSVSANSLTNVNNSITFEMNEQLTNISFNSLTSITGDLTILNNTALEEIDQFAQLETISGAILLAGSFSKVEMPKLSDVKGAVTVTSTTNITSFCQFFDKLKSSGAIQGKESCTSNNVNANSGGQGGTGSNSSDSAAMSHGVNYAVAGFAAFAGFAQLF